MPLNLTRAISRNAYSILLCVLCAPSLSAQIPTYYFTKAPHIAYGGGWSTTLYFTSTPYSTGETVHCVVVDTEGTATAYQYTLNVPLRSVVKHVIETPTDPIIHMGALKCSPAPEVTSGLKVEAVYDFASPDGVGFQAGFGDSSWISSGSSWNYDGQTYRHGLACAFGSPLNQAGSSYIQSYNFNIRLYQNGAPITDPITLNPKQKYYFAHTLEVDFPMLTGKTGVLVVSGIQQPPHCVMLRFNDTRFSVVPIQ